MVHPTDLPSGAERGPARRCYANASLHSEAYGLTYVEGFALAAPHLCAAHAWCARPDGTVEDPTWAVTGSPTWASRSHALTCSTTRVAQASTPCCSISTGSAGRCWPEGWPSTRSLRSGCLCGSRRRLVSDRSRRRAGARRVRRRSPRSAMAEAPARQDKPAAWPPGLPSPTPRRWRRAAPRRMRAGRLASNVLARGRRSRCRAARPTAMSSTTRANTQGSRARGRHRPRGARTNRRIP